MNSATLLTNVAQTIDLTVNDAENLLAAMTTAIRECCSTLDAVAVPGFGTIQPIKHDEEVRTDLSTGKRMLMPPSIEVEFKSSVVLRKRLVK